MSHKTTCPELLKYHSTVDSVFSHSIPSPGHFDLLELTLLLQGRVHHNRNFFKFFSGNRKMVCPEERDYDEISSWNLFLQSAKCIFYFFLKWNWLLWGFEELSLILLLNQSCYFSVTPPLQSCNLSEWWRQVCVQFSSL